jgi:hypothetical protein
MPSAHISSAAMPPIVAYMYRGSCVWTAARFLVFSVSNTSHNCRKSTSNRRRISHIRGMKWKASQPIRRKHAQQQSTILIERGCNASAVQYPGDFAFFLPGEIPAYLFCEKIGSHNEYPHFEAQSCQTRIRGRIWTTPVHQIVSSARWEGYVAASRIPMVKAVFTSEK